MDDPKFSWPLFLGPQAENAPLLERLLVDLVRDHCFWRRNFHPEDGLAIPPEPSRGPEHDAQVARSMAALQKLSAQLKRAVPFFSPRYVGHMNADLLIPGIVAQMVTTLYNPNNVSEESAPVTLDMELAVGRQLATMFGMSVDDDAEPCAWGHLTSGGTVANYEALWNFRCVRYYGVALQAGAAEIGFEPGDVGPHQKPLGSYSYHELLNLSIDETIELRQQCVDALRDAPGGVDVRALSEAVRGARLETLGSARFFVRYSGQVPPPKIFVPSSGHYSWEKGMKVLGLGTDNLVRVHVDDCMRMDAAHLEQCLLEAADRGETALCVVGVLGTTEFGTVDPIHEILEVRERVRQRCGLYPYVHVDAAWGGYMASIFRREDGSMIPRNELRREFRAFPGETLYQSFAALADVDSITVDPHKMGYVPYPAGAFVARNRRIVDFIAQEAAYVFDLGASETEVPTGQKLHALGKYILEGSKPGSAAAAVHVVHEVLPLHERGFGRMLKGTIHAAEAFYAKAREMREKLIDVVHLGVPFETDSHLMCLALNPRGNKSLKKLNQFGRTLFQAMKVDPDQPVQVQEFIGSYTSLFAKTLSPAIRERILLQLGIDPRGFVDELPVDATDADDVSDHLFLLRHTLMNPWLLSVAEDGRNGVERYWDWLEVLVRKVVAEG